MNFENIKRKIQRIISDSCFQFKSRFNVDARALSIPLLNFPFKSTPCCQIKTRNLLKEMVQNIGPINLKDPIL